MCVFLSKTLNLLFPKTLINIIWGGQKRYFLVNQNGQVTFIKIKINHFEKNRGKYLNSIVGVEYYPARRRARSGRSCGFMLLFFMSRGIADISGKLSCSQASEYHNALRAEIKQIKTKLRKTIVHNII